MMKTETMYVRKSVYDLSSAEVQALRDAFKTLYETPIAGNQSLIDQFANTYQELANILITYGHYERNDLLFLPWARAYFWWFEQALREINPEVTLPYWDYTSKEAIASGIPPLLNDPKYINENGEEEPNPLYRANYKFPLHTYRETPENTELLKAAAVAVIPAMKEENFVDFGTAIYPVDILSHSYIGGSSANTNTTAYDPIFWFTHCQLDHFWWQWQNLKNDYTAPDSVLTSKLVPFTTNEDDKKEFLTSTSVMNTESLGYTYE